MKTVLVTGASSGIGAAISRYLSECGYYIVMVARDEEKLKSVAADLKDDCLIIPFDLQDLEHIEDIFKICEKKELKLDGMVHAAGINRDMPIRMNDIKAMEEVTAIHYYSFVELGKFFNKKKYSREGASIVAISSIASIHHDKGMCTYSAAKAALDVAVSVMSKEFLKRGQRVNAILPNLVRTPMVTDSPLMLSDYETRAEQQPLGIIEPIQIAYLAEFLLSDKASHITDAHIPVGGG